MNKIITMGAYPGFDFESQIKFSFTGVIRHRGFAPQEQRGISPVPFSSHGSFGT
jgi:hypothetical protein